MRQPAGARHAGMEHKAEIYCPIADTGTEDFNSRFNRGGGYGKPP
jgi:hypothetical protein